MKQNYKENLDLLKKEINMRKSWISSDYHFGEDRFDLMGRPFKTVEDHNNAIIDRHNELVAPEDIVFVNGDVIYQKANIDEMLPLIGKMNGRKVLIRGNHDRVVTDEQFKPYFETIVAEGGGVPLEVEGIPCYITHYPTQGVKDRFNLTGHIHLAWKFQLNMLNVGVDVNHFYPVSMDKIPFFVRAITEFYDEDVWVAYREENSSYRETRGKKDVYFKG
jgi:calcineurin-like phosphoesterase family protein